MPDAKNDERHIICTVRGKASQRDRVRELLLELVAPARAEPGCLYYDLYQDGTDPDTHYIVDGWVSQEAIADHTAHANVTRVVEQLLPLLEVPLEVTTSVRISENA